MDSVFAGIGEWLANLYMAYGLLFLGGGSMICLHLAVLVFVGWRRDGVRFRRLHLTVEIVYGLLDPLIYLLFLEQPFDLRFHEIFNPIGWIVLLTVWGARLWGGLARAANPRGSIVGRRVARALLWTALVTVVAFLAKDVVVFLRHASEPTDFSTATLLGLMYFLNVAALYAIPAAALWRLLRLTAHDDASGSDSFYLLSPRFAAASAALVVLTLALWNLPRSPGFAERQVLAQRAAILEASERHQLDPRLIASVLYVISRDHSAPFARQIEGVAMGAWLTDAKNDMGFGEPLDLSIGITQIRPLTALTALVIYDAAGAPAGDEASLLDVALARLNAGGTYKDFRGLPALDARWRLPATAVSGLRPAFSGLPSKAEIVEQLFDDRQNVEMCGLILALYAAQWRAADPAWDIHDRPEILATLYQRGFERSQPKANPRPNAFGESVRAIYESTWMKDNFGAAPAR